MRSLELQNYINLARNGHYPLFFKEWIDEGLRHNIKSSSYMRATKTVDLVFKNLEKHKGTERKKNFLMSLKDEERREFVKSFYTLVEYDLTRELKELH